MQSHPSWVRGLKLVYLTEHAIDEESHPSWVRGLKHEANAIKALAEVAPLVGAWIETKVYVSSSSIFKSHPSWVRGLKLVSHDISAKQ